MSAIPGVRLDITGASGSQGLLGPKSSWRVYVLPRGGYAAQSSTGTLVTFDSAAIAGRFAALNWIQAGLDTANIRQVAAVGGNSLSVSGSALTIAENDYIFLIGNTQPTVTGGSATYTIPATVIRQRDDDAADLYTNSMVTTNSDGLAQFFSTPAVYDAIIQDGNQANQGSIIALPVGVAEGVSTSFASTFGATVTINAFLGVSGSVGISGTLTVGQTTTLNAAMGVTGWATFGTSVTVAGALGVTGHATFGSTITGHGNLGITGSMVVGGSLGVTGVLGVTGQATLAGVSLSYIGIRGNSVIAAATGLTISSGWGATGSISVVASWSSTRACGGFIVTAGGAGVGANPTVTLTFGNTVGNVTNPVVFTQRSTLGNFGLDQLTVPFTVNATASACTFTFRGTPVSGEAFQLHYFIIGAQP